MSDSVPSAPRELCREPSSRAAKKLDNPLDAAAASTRVLPSPPSARTTITTMNHTLDTAMHTAARRSMLMSMAMRCPEAAFAGVLSVS